MLFNRRSDYLRARSGVDTAYERASLKSPAGWVLRAYGAPPAAWKRWYGDVCNRPQEAVAVGDEELMSGMDDFVPPNDAYVHDQLTSGSYGYDHFGNLVCLLPVRVHIRARVRSPDPAPFQPPG